MKKKLLLIIGIITFGLTVTLNIETVEAASSCTVRNYYFLNEINYSPHYTNLATSNSYPWERNHTTEFSVASIPSNAISTVSGSKIELTKTGTSNGVQSWSLADFYDKYKLGVAAGGDYSTTEDGMEVHYLIHGAWYEDNGVIRSTIVDFTNVDTEDLVAGSILPSSTTTQFLYDYDTSGVIVNINVRRTIEYNDVLEDDSTLAVTPFNVAWTEGGAEIASILTPALAYLEYETECPSQYKATIHYLEYGTDKVLATDYLETNLENDTTDNVTSPSINGYTLKNNTDKVVIYTINGADFEYTVYYVPNTEPVSQVNTGDTMIYIVWGIGVLALGYSIYYFTKYYKKEQDM